MKQYVSQSEKTQARLQSHLEVTDPKSFATNPQGYNHRLEATIMQLATHKSAVVRAAVAANPLTRDMFITAMSVLEKDAKVLKVLQPRLDAISKKSSTVQTLEAKVAEKDAIIANLQAKLSNK